MIGFFILLICLIGLNMIALLNAATFPHLKAASQHVGRVSILIPARNEAANIGDTIRSLIAQPDPGLEILLLDDHSSDGTAEIASQAAEGDQRVRVLAGRPLPPGWLGKAWACQQLGEQAQGDILIFSDADVRWQPGAVAALVAHIENTRADLLTAWPQQIAITWAERLVVPLMAFSVLGYLPVLAVHHIPWTAFAAAIGQCLVFRRSAYQQIGSHAAVRQSVVDDMAFAWAIKRAGLRLRLADSAGMLKTRMYHNWNEVRQGFAKNILAGHANSLALLGLSTLFHWAAFVFPWLWLALGWLSRPASAYPWMPLTLVLLGISLRAVTTAISRQRLDDAIFLPFSVLLMTVIAAQGVKWRLNGGPRWKGRTLSL
jgi:chlorobactene glucosyltransferase